MLFELRFVTHTAFFEFFLVNTVVNLHHVLESTRTWRHWKSLLYRLWLLNGLHHGRLWWLGLLPLLLVAASMRLRHVFLTQLRDDLLLRIDLSLVMGHIRLFGVV